MKKILVVLLILAMGLMACKGDDKPSGASGSVDILGAFKKNKDIYVVKKDFSAENITNTADITEEDPQISPNGTKIVMEVEISEGGGIYNDIFIMNIDGSNRINLTNSSMKDEFNPVWINNQTILYVYDGDMYSMDINTQNSTKLTNYSGTQYSAGKPSVSPDKTKVAFSLVDEGSVESGDDIWVMNIDGSNPTNITQTTDMNENEPAWVNNSKIVYQRYNDSTSSDLFTHDLNSGEKTNITNTSNKYEDKPAVSVDGKKILYVVETDRAEDKTEIYMMHIDGTGVQNISNSVGIYDGDPCWNPKFITE